MLGRAVHLAIAVSLLLALWPGTALGQSSCRFVLGFASLRDLVGTAKVGSCLEDEHFNLENGNAEQRTSGGLLVWRKVDNFTAFTDGGTTWVNGPNGLQSRPNADRFSWEKDPVRTNAGTSTTASQAPATTSQAPASSAPSVMTSSRPSGSAPATVTVPSELQPAWDALTGIDAKIPGGGDSDTVGALMLKTARVTGVTLKVGQLADGVAGQYKVSDNSLTVNRALIKEDRRALAAVISHELTHARQVLQGDGGRPDCVRMEVDAYTTEAFVWASFWQRQAPPRRTALERHLTGLLEVAVSEGEPGFYKMVVETPGYQGQCQLWVPDGAAQASPSSRSSSSAPPSRLTDSIRSRCVKVVNNFMKDIPVDAETSKLQTMFLEHCLEVAEEAGDPGVTCVETTFKDVRSAIMRGQRPRAETINEKERECIDRARK